MIGGVTAAVGIVLTLIYAYLTWNFNYWRQRAVRGPKPKILNGNFEKTNRGEGNFIEELHEIYLEYKTKERFVGVFTARTPRLFILDPVVALQILTTNFGSFHDNESSRWSNPEVERLRCESPFVSVGESWREKRSEVVPALTVNRLRSFYPVMQKAAKKLSDFIEIHQNELDAKELSGRFTTELMADFIWGINADAFRVDKLSHIQEVANDMISQALKCVRYYGQTAAWPWLRKWKPERFFPTASDKFFTQLTTTAVTHRLENPNDRPDVLNHLLQLCDKKQLSAIQLAGHSTTVLIDGFETASIAIAHCLYLLGKNKPAQEKLRKEILESLDERDQISFDRLNDLPYLDQCVQETLRIFPPLSTLFKLCTADTTLENFNGERVILKPGDSVYISSYSFHRDGDIFENPEDFIPERFDPDAGGSRKYRDMGVFLPFGDGPRMCLGMKLGLVETKVAVAEVVRKFNITLCHSTRLDNQVAPNSFLLSLKGGIVLNFRHVK